MGVRRDGETTMILDAVGIQKNSAATLSLLMVDAILEIERPGSASWAVKKRHD